MSIKGFIEKCKKSFKTQIYITIFCGKIPVYFLQILFERVSVKISKVSVGSTCSCFRLLPLKFSKMISWGRWSEIEVVMLPERYLKDGLFIKMLSISVADFSFTLVGSVICGVKLWLKNNSRKLCVSFLS